MRKRGTRGMPPLARLFLLAVRAEGSAVGMAWSMPDDADDELVAEWMVRYEGRAARADALKAAMLARVS